GLIGTGGAMKPTRTCATLAPTRTSLTSITATWYSTFCCAPTSTDTGLASIALTLPMTTLSARTTRSGIEKKIILQPAQAWTTGAAASRTEATRATQHAVEKRYMQTSQEVTRAIRFAVRRFKKAGGLVENQ